MPVKNRSRGGARLVAPERRGIVIRFAFGQPCKCLRGPHVRIGYGAQRHRFACGEHGEQGRKCRLQARDQIVRALPVVIAQTLDCHSAPFVGVNLAVGRARAPL